MRLVVKVIRVDLKIGIAQEYDHISLSFTMFTAGNPHRGEPTVWSSSLERSPVAITEGSCGFCEFQLGWQLKL